MGDTRLPGPYGLTLQLSAFTMCSSQRWYVSGGLGWCNKIDFTERGGGSDLTGPQFVDLGCGGP